MPPEVIHALRAPADASQLDAAGALARKRMVEQRLGAIRNDPSKLQEREALKREDEALGARIRELKEIAKRENARRNFAGLGSPLHEAIVEQLPPEVVSQLEAAAFGKLADRERRTEERKAGKVAVAPSAGAKPQA